MRSKLWNRDASAMKQAMTQYTKRSGSLSAMSAAIGAALAADAKADADALIDSVFVELFKYVARFSFRDFLAQSVATKDLVAVLQNRGVAQMAENKRSVLARQR